MCLFGDMAMLAVKKGTFLISPAYVAPSFDNYIIIDMRNTIDALTLKTAAGIGFTIFNKKNIVEFFINYAAHFNILLGVIL